MDLKGELCFYKHSLSRYSRHQYSPSLNFSFLLDILSFKIRCYCPASWNCTSFDTCIFLAVVGDTVNLRQHGRKIHKAMLSRGSSCPFLGQHSRQSLSIFLIEILFHYSGQRIPWSTLSEVCSSVKLTAVYWAWPEMLLFSEIEPEIILLKPVIIIPVVFVLIEVF